MDGAGRLTNVQSDGPSVCLLYLRWVALLGIIDRGGCDRDLTVVDVGFLFLDMFWAGRLGGMAFGRA